MNDQVRTLSVRAIMDAGAYARGGREVVSANREMAASAAATGTAIAQTQVKLSNAADPATRLGRAYDQAGTAQAKFRADLLGLNRALEANKVSTEQAAAIYAGMVSRLNMVADAADIARQGYAMLGNVVEQTNRKIAQDQALAAAARDAELYGQKAAALRAQLDPAAASQARLNAEIAEYTTLLNRAEISTAEFAQAQVMAQTRHEQFIASLGRGSGVANDNNAQFRRQNLGYQMFDVAQMQALGQNPVMTLMQQGPQIAQLYAGNGGVKAALADVGAIAGGIVSTIGAVPLALGAAGAAAIAYFTLSGEKAKTLDELIQEQTESLKLLGNAYGDVAAQADRAFTAGNRNAFGISSASSLNGLNLGITTEMSAAMSNFMIDRGGLASGNQFGPAKIVSGEFEAFSGAIDELRNSALKGTPDVLAFRKAVEDQWALDPNNEALTLSAAKLFEWTAKAAQAANAARELEIAQRALFNNVGPGGFLLSQGTTNRADMGNMDALRQQQQVQQQRTQAQLEAQRASIMAVSPEQKADAARAIAASQYDESETPQARKQRIELAGKQALLTAEEELRKAQEARERSSAASLASAQNELSIAGLTVAERNRLRAAYEAEAQIRQAAAAAGVAADEKEIAAARAKAAAIADINAQIAATRMLQDQNDQIEQLRLEAQLIGASADERARATAALQAEQQLRQQGISLLSQEGQQYVQNAEAMATARLEIERQNAAFASMQQTGTSALSSLITGTGSFKERLKSALDTSLTWIQQMTLVNPLSNSLFKTNLPTMTDLFSGRPAIPGATSTATMTVTAGTVMVNGGVTSGLLPGANTTLGGFLGVPSAANQNVANGVTEAASTVAGTSTQSQVWNYWAAKGLPPHQIAGIMGNMNAESAFNPAAVGDGGNAFGLAQWNDRAPAMKAFVGSDWKTDTQGQMDFMNHEFQTTEAASWAKLRASTDVRSATAAVAGFERPLGYSAANPENSHNWSGRLDAANASLTKFSSTAATASKDVSVLGDSSVKVGTSITDSLGKLATPAAVPSVPTTATTPTATGSNPFAALFGWIPKLFGFADGTDFSPGGLAIVGERGRELVNLPRGSQVIPNHKLPSFSAGPQKIQHQHAWSVSVSGMGDKELMARTQVAAEESFGRMMREFNDNILPGRVQDIAQNPYHVGAAA